MKRRRQIQRQRKTNAIVEMNEKTHSLSDYILTHSAVALVAFYLKFSTFFTLFPIKRFMRVTSCAHTNSVSIPRIHTHSRQASAESEAKSTATNSFNISYVMSKRMGKRAESKARQWAYGTYGRLAKSVSTSHAIVSNTLNS